MALLVLFAVLLPVLLVGLVMAVVRAATAPALDEVGRRARTRSVVATVLTLVAGAAAIWLWNELALVRLQIRLATMPALAGAVAVAMATVADLTWPRQGGTVRRASLAPRTVRSPAILRRAFWTAGGAAAVALSVGALTADRSGQVLSRHWPSGAVTHGPYPGPPYAVPVTIACLLLLLATRLGLRAVAARPALDADHAGVDASLRAVSAVRVLRGGLFGLAATAGGLLFVMGQAILGVTGDGTPTAPVLRLLGVVAVVAAAALALLAAASVVWPAPRVASGPPVTELAGHRLAP